ncbi:hypothetical protein E3P99_02409 [Wallemia hederae]|uniref:Uncharacterized protein n=1 Tax=Wallemia hederae TaxID=1540922 RepID=A0A4T0FL12_9BASI|nr:hypothetical protein E3P99_02409 [Wallemia hederae]
MDYFEYQPRHERYFTHDDTGEKHLYTLLNASYINDNQSVELLAVRKHHPRPVQIRMFDRRYDQTRAEGWDRRKEETFRQALIDEELDGQAAEIDAHTSCRAQYERDGATLELIKEEHLYCVQDYTTTISFEFAVAPEGASQELFTARGFLLDRIDGAMPLSHPFSDADSQKIIKDAYKSFDALAAIGILLADCDMENMVIVNDFGLEVRFTEISGCQRKSEAVSHAQWKEDVAHHRVLFRDAFKYTVEENLRKQMPQGVYAQQSIAWTDSSDSVQSGYILHSFIKARRRSWRKLRETVGTALRLR